jgi:hypothetical protein
MFLVYPLPYAARISLPEATSKIAMRRNTLDLRLQLYLALFLSARKKTFQERNKSKEEEKNDDDEKEENEEQQHMRSKVHT